ncbi:Guanine nucleotide exchange factor Ric8 [Penicillium verhagenii]|nr:Guanine nucleotide exchange factor Ric8 [Penicillium verhagenii]
MDFHQSPASKLQETDQLLDSLEQDLQEKKLTSTQKTETLLRLRELGATHPYVGPIYSNKGIHILAQYGVEGETPDVCRAALRCLANALFLQENLRQVYVNTGYGGRLAERLRLENSDDEMPASRILFLLTYNTTMDFDKLIKNHSLGENIIIQLTRHANQFPKSGGESLTQMDQMALTETLKLIFNISKLYDLGAAFSPAIPFILKIISRIQIPTRPLDGLMGQLINALFVLDIEEKNGKLSGSNPLFPAFDPKCNIDKLINILDRSVSVYNPDELDKMAVPLLHSLIVIYGVAPDELRKHMQSLLLPADSDRSEPIGRSDTLASRLLKLSTGPNEHLKTGISELMFVLADRDAENLTRRIGYGFAAGFLASRGMEIPKSASEAYADGATELDAVNPITGQRWAAEAKDSGPPMTKAEKEREAERLFVLFERAKANGLLNVENPVTQALHEGRFEELPDDTDSD